MAVAALLIVIAGCGGDDGGATGLVDDRAPEVIMADFDLASSALLTLDDLPDGWKGTVVQEDATLNQRLFACLGLDDTSIVANDQAEATSQFALGDAAIASLVNVYPTAEYATASLEPVFDPEFVDCYRTILRDSFAGQLPAGGTLDLDGSVEDLSGMGDEGATLHLDARLSVAGQERSTSIDFTLVRIGRVLMSLQLSNLGAPFDPTLADQLLHLSVERATSI
jgi:hypothetical protein